MFALDLRAEFCVRDRYGLGGANIGAGAAADQAVVLTPWPGLVIMHVIEPAPRGDEAQLAATGFVRTDRRNHGVLSRAMPRQRDGLAVLVLIGCGSLPQGCDSFEPFFNSPSSISNVRSNTSKDRWSWVTTITAEPRSWATLRNSSIT